MCIFTHHTYLCLHEKVKLTQPCADARLDAGGGLYCPHDPNPAHLDKASKYREYTSQRTWGAGVCASLQCQWARSLLPIGHFGKGKISLEDDTPIEMTQEALAHREDQWYRMLSTEQQLEALGTTWPQPGPDLLRFTDPDTIPWQSLNPRYLDAQTLHWLLYCHILPASLVLPPGPRTSPLKPKLGPHKYDRHMCIDKPGICKICGTNIPSLGLREKSAAWQETDARLADFAAEYGELGTRDHPGDPALTAGQFWMSRHIKNGPLIDDGPAALPWDEDVDSMPVQAPPQAQMQMQMQPLPVPQQASAMKEVQYELDDKGRRFDFTGPGETDDGMEIDFDC